MDLYFARKYIWWQSAETGVKDRHRVIVQVMNLGTFEDVQAQRKQIGDAESSRRCRKPSGHIARSTAATLAKARQG